MLYLWYYIVICKIFLLYFIFNIKKEFYNLYKDKPSELFYIFNKIYYMREIEKEYGYNLFETVSNFYDKDYVNSFIYNRYKVFTFRLL